ncbi:S8 family serine peptidase [Arthrobacter sp. MSA 4-2]|uniref:S8 family serine peptidase n=1 Tax=Arthrobacter sp. MSA 4-2 TaxID=2794349 RepID=UPI0018E7D69D|nr:S8 family serine peptidase [Arthrobacter sp. MSA 4-2]MBJ2120796.1 S8 family serine peptidase [Arthrobacter sp. MSA 4-2]
MIQRGQAGLRSPRLRRVTAIALGVPLLMSSAAVTPAVFAAQVPAQTSTQLSGVSPSNFTDGRYIVVLKEHPLAMYEGGADGIPATKPGKGEKLTKESPHARAYEARLKKSQTDVAAAVNAEVGKSFTTALNGFTSYLTAEQAALLSKNPNVYVVAPDTQNSPDYSSADFLGLTGEDGLWATQLGGAANAGKGTVVGVIDTGYRPENPFLTGAEVKPLQGDPVVGEPYLTPDGKIAMLKADGSTFLGECQTGQDFDGSACNSKVLSARYFADDFLGSVPEEDRSPDERISPIDVDSHGTHTASTAAGNADVEATVDGRSFGKGAGVAPAAAVSVYKICWEDKDPNSGGCYSSSAVEAIEQSILDGVDVLNYSISGNNNSTTDPVALAFLSAASAGIFVSTSAGNSGPTVSTVNHSSPWLTTVAASTFSHELQGTVELSDGTKYRGTSVMNREVPQTAAVLAADAAAAGVSAADAALCKADSLDPAKVTGKIVVCDRGVVDRVLKSATVEKAGGVGMILVNVVPGSLDLDLHAVPTVHIDGVEIKEKLKANPALTAALVDEDTTGLPTPKDPQIAAFSSRGPSLAVNSDFLKPDITAPGVNVLAGVSPVGTGENFGFLSGTSMAAPQVAGLGALVLAKNPAWSPAAVKSALMTTAGDVLTEEGAANNDVFAVGAGHVNPAAMLSPGLVYDADAAHWNGFLQSLGAPLGLRKPQVVGAKDVNVPSIAVGKLTGKVTVTRTVTATAPGSYTATVDLPGIATKVSPARLDFAAAGESKSFKVTFENKSAALDAFAMGSLTWTEAKGATVTSPIAVRPVTAVMPAAVSFTSAAGTGSGTFNVTAGTTGTVDLSVKGLAKADRTDVELVPGPASGTANASNSVTEVEVPAGTSLARFAVNSADANADFDLFVITPSGGEIAAATASASESVLLNNPAPGTYTVVANLYSSPDNRPTKATVDAVVLGGDEGNLKVSPDPIQFKNGKEATVSLSWTGLEPGSYVGRVFFGDAGSTAVSLEVGANGATTVTPTGSPVLVEDAAATPAAGGSTLR